MLPLYDVSLCMPFFRSVTNYRLEILHGYDVNPRADPWTFVHDSETGRVERSLGYTGILPLPCIEECAEDLNCHGGVPPPPRKALFPLAVPRSALYAALARRLCDLSGLVLLPRG